MKCQRVTERDEEGLVHTACPTEAEDEVLVVNNNLPYIIPMCTFHKAEFHQKFAEARNRRKARNDAAARSHQARRRG